MAELTVATFNLWGFGEPWCYTAERGEVRGAVPGSPAATIRPPEGVWPRRRRLLARALASADVAMLQEVCIGPDGRSQAHELAEELGHRCAFVPFEEDDYGTGRTKRGLAVLARGPVEARREIRFPWPDPAVVWDGAHYALHAAVAGLELIVVHLSPRSELAGLDAAERLIAYLDGLPAGSTVVLAGDLNEGPGVGYVRLLTARLRDAWAIANPDDPGPTVPSHRPLTPRDRPTRFDYVLVGHGPDVVRAELLGTAPDADGFYASDHLGVAATLRFPG